MEGNHADPDSTGVATGFHYRSDLFVPVGQAREHRGDEHPAGYPGTVEAPHHVEPFVGRRRARFREAPDLPVERPDREVDPHARAGGRFHQQGQVSQHQCRLGEDAEGVATVAEGADDPARQMVLALGVLVRVGVRTHRDQVTLPARGRNLGPGALDRVDLDHYPPLEVLSYPETEELVGRAGEAVRARVRAAPVGVDGVLERHPRGRRHSVDDAPGVDVEELEPPVLTPADVALGPRPVEQGTRSILVLDRPPEPVPLVPVALGPGHGVYRTYVRRICRAVEPTSRADQPGRPAGPTSRAEWLSGRGIGRPRGRPRLLPASWTYGTERWRP